VRARRTGGYRSAPQWPVKHKDDERVYWMPRRTINDRLRKLQVAK
jgi:hypothetical protein